MSSSHSNSTVRTPRATVEQLLHAYVHGRRPDVADFYAPEVHIDNPWVREGMPSEFRGDREALRARFEQSEKMLSFDSVRDVHIHEGADPEDVVVELRFDLTIRDSGANFSVGFIWFLRIVDGLIVSSRDYANPLETDELAKLFASRS